MDAYLGFKDIEGPSIQCGSSEDVHQDAIYWINQSGASEHQWVVCLDEIGPANKGAMPDSYDPGHDTIRHEVLWGNLMAGGAGVEWYFGYRYPHSDLSCEDWRSRDNLWEQTKIALEFFHRYLPFTEMISSDELTKDENDYCFAKKGEIYTIYLPEGNGTDILLPAGNFSIDWFNPRTGGEFKKGTAEKISGSGYVSTGNPPEKDGKDWVCLIRKE